MSKNLIYMVAIDSERSQFKNSDYAQYSIQSWQLWCDKNNVDFIVNREHDTRFTFPIWNKELIYEIGKGYDKIGIVDSDTIISPDAPNIFDLFTEEDFCGVQDLCDLNWLLSSIKGRQHFFPETKMSAMKYFNAGVLFFGSKHLKVFEDLLNLYLSNQKEIDEIKGGGKEQTLLNFVVQSSGVEVKLLTPAWNLISIHRKNMFIPNWQLKKDPTPYFMKYAYIWHFTGFPIEDRTRLMQQTWEVIKPK
jgi:lipopolysaccharide biosynthesis glycosyltransferase